MQIWLFDVSCHAICRRWSEFYSVRHTYITVLFGRLEPLHFKNRNNFKLVQLKLTKRLPRIRNLSYRQRLTKLKLLSLELRRLHVDLLFTYKLVFSMIELKVSDFFISYFRRASRRHQYQLGLYLLTCKRNIRFNSYTYCVLFTWNNLLLNETDFSFLLVLNHH